METIIQEVIVAAKEAKRIGWETFYYQFTKADAHLIDEVITEARNRTLGAIQPKNVCNDCIEFILI